MSLVELSISELHSKLESKEITTTEVVQACYTQIKNVDPKIHAFLTLNEEQALEKAKRMDAVGDFSKPLSGIPVGVKDMICTKNLRTTAGSKILENFVPPYSATAVYKLEEAGAIVIGKMNMDEFAMGSSTENSGYFPTNNPWDTARVPGGSSGGSAAAVAARMCPATLGTDTGGSIRQPASLCGVVGVKPTYGRVSRFGAIAMASSLDQIGPFARTVEDAALMMEVLAGQDPLDATTLNDNVPKYTASLQKGVKGMKIGLPKEYFEEGLAPDVARVTQEAIQVLKDQGAEIVELSLPYTKYALPVYYLVMPSEVSANLSRFDGVRYGAAPDESEVRVLDDIYTRTRSRGFGAEPKRRIILGAFALSAGYQDKYYQQAQKVRTLIKQDFDDAFKQVDAIVTPVSPTIAWKMGEKVADPLQMYLSDIYTIPANLAGICGISVPVGLSQNLPVGLQVLCPQLGEETMFQVGYAVDNIIQFHKQNPPVLLAQS